jgi:hypothetical protein
MLSVLGFQLMKLVGDPAGKVVIDVACGERFLPAVDTPQRGGAKSPA